MPGRRIHLPSHSEISKPFLLLGYERSGTTLFRRLMSMHPRLDYDLYHERPKRFLSCSTAKEALKKMRKPCTQGGETIGSEMSIESGIKVAYTKAKLALEVINRFLWMFPQGSIVHAIRTPADCISSQMRTFDRPFDRCLTMYFDSVPIVSSASKPGTSTIGILKERMMSFIGSI